MRVVMFYHSLLSDWNHGNAHFLRGIVNELLLRQDDVKVFEPVDSWSLANLLREHGHAPLRSFRIAYPLLQSIRYDLSTLDLDEALDGADLVIVHEWNPPELVRAIGRHRVRSRYRLLFHDTHHRMVTDPEAMARYDLSDYDGALVYGEVLRELYESRGNVRKAWTWHEAADSRMFKPLDEGRMDGDLVWIGNWGDDERTAELQEFLIEPSRALMLKTHVYGVRYPGAARRALAKAGIKYSGWLANFEAPQVFSRFAFTIHVTRRPYVRTLQGIPTIRVFEALASGIPLICSPWNDVEELFEPGADFLVARNGREMAGHMRDLLHDRDLATALVRHGMRTIHARHTCAHRVNELLDIYSELAPQPALPAGVNA